MKNKIFKKRYIAAILSVFLMSSCDALLDQDETDFGQGPILAQFSKPVAEINILKDEANTPVVYDFEIAYFGGKGVALDQEVTISIAASSQTEIPEGTGFEILTPILSIPAGSTTAMGSIKVLTGPLVPFDFKDIVLEITDSSQSIAELNTLTLTLKALGANSLAGRYEIIESNYWRIGVNNGSFNSSGDGIRIIEALSEDTYKHPDWAGQFDGNNWFFKVDSDNKVTVLLKDPTDGSDILLNDLPIITCVSNPGNMTNTPCATSNVVTRTDDRHDIIKVSYGYLAESGPREFYEVLRRLE